MTFKPRTFNVPLYQGDYQQRIAKAEQAVHAAEERAKKNQTQPRLMGDKSEVEQLVDEHNALVAEAEKQGRTVVTLKALGRKRWNLLIKEHPPRTSDDVPADVRESDKAVGVNDETFGEALLTESISAVSDETPVAELLEAISAAQYDLLYGTAFRLNRDGGPLPFAMPTPTPLSQSGAETGN